MSVCFWFRLKQPENNRAYVGIACAPSMEALYWELDQYLDPGEIELHPIDGCASVCFHEEADGDEIILSELEVSGYQPEHNSKGWKQVKKWMRNCC